MMSREPYTLTGLFGHPVGHSRSPHMQNAAFAAKGIPYLYMAFDIQPDQIGASVAGIRALGMRGVNVTIPYKVDVIPFLDRMTPEAELIGAVNTIVNENGELIGHNTDGNGYVRSLLEETNISLPDANVLVLGAGGAARAVSAALAMHGAKSVLVANRTREKGEQLVESLSSICQARALLTDEIPDQIGLVQLVVNTTSVGMYPSTQEVPIDPGLLREGQVVSDLIYNPRETRLLREAKQRGAIPHGGLGMFIYQGAEAFSLWTGLEAPVEVMRKTVEELL